VSIGSQYENRDETGLRTGSAFENRPTLVITWFFVHFPMGFPWDGLVCGVVGHILKRIKIFFLETSGCKVGLMEQPLFNQACFV
jgi:hypothetical protein